MSEGTRRPPSYYRYREGHPTVSVVLSKSLKDAIDAAKPADVSYGQFIKGLLTKAGGSFAQAEAKWKAGREEGYAEGRAVGHQLGYKKGHTEGYSKGLHDGEDRGFGAAVAIYMIEVPCEWCRKPVPLTTHPDTVRLVSECLRRVGWGHRECHRRFG